VPEERTHREYFDSLRALTELTVLGEGNHLAPGHSCVFKSAHGRIVYGAVFGANRIRTELFTKDPRLRGRFEQLRTRVPDLLREAAHAGHELMWDTPAHRKALRIKVEIERPADLTPESLGPVRRWHLYWLLRFHQSFERHIMKWP
jgi:hypothetical protein